MARFVWQRAAAAKDSLIGGKSYCLNADKHEFLPRAPSVLVSTIVSAVKEGAAAGRNIVSDSSIFASFVSSSSLLFVVLDVASAFISTLNIITFEYYDSFLRIFKLSKSEMHPYRHLAITA